MADEIVKVIELVPGTVNPLTTVQAESLDEATFWTDFVCKHKPVLIKGAVKSWPAFELWASAGYLESLCGDERVGISNTFNPLPLGPYVHTAVKHKKLRDRKSTRLNSSHPSISRMPSSA